MDATRGLRDYADDLAELLAVLGIGRAHLVGWSMGGGVVMQYLRDRPAAVRSLTLVNPVSPYGYGGTRTGDDHYPGDSTVSGAWPGVAPGTRGVLNCLAPTHFRIDDLHLVEPRPPVLWVRGEDDVIVSDTSMFDLAHLGSLGAVPGWDGTPAKPMVAQTRHVLARYAAAGGTVREVAVADAGHTVDLERPEEFGKALLDLLTA